MLKAGCHLSPSKGYLAMAETARELGGNTFQFFLRNPRGSRAKEMNIQNAEAMNVFLKENAMGPILMHAPYTLNLCAKEERVEEFARQVLEDDLKRAACFPGNLYNLHPGSHVGQGVQAGIDKTARLLCILLEETEGISVTVETMAGQGSEIGSDFTQIGEILRLTGAGDRLGVCLDTCHVFGAGYDIVHDLEGVLEDFDQHIGLKHLLALHLNDSMMPLGSRKDRHAPIGAGYIGRAAFASVVNHPVLKNLPMVLETPHAELSGYAQEIALLRRLAGE